MNSFFIPFFLTILVLIGGSVFGFRYIRRLSAYAKKLNEENKSVNAQLSSQTREKKNEPFIETIINALPEAVFIVDNDLKLVHVNSTARSIFSIARDSISLLEATFSTELENAAKAVIENSMPGDSEIIIYNNKRQYYFRVLIAPMENYGIFIILNDITKLHRLEKVRKDFAANVSHELRTPIQLIKGYSETILEQKPDYDQLLRVMEIIHKNAVTMENLTNDLLILVSLEDEESPRLEMVETNVRELLEEAVRSVEPKGTAKDTQIKVSCGNELTVRLYGPFIIQAVINLLDNAIKYSPPSTKVKVEAELADLAEGKELVIKVKDKGIGIPREYQERIFERFFRVDKARGRDGSTGLGLAIVRHICLLHQGRVEVESHAGEGSCFILHIPAN